MEHSFTYGGIRLKKFFDCNKYGNYSETTENIDKRINRFLDSVNEAVDEQGNIYYHCNKCHAWKLVSEMCDFVYLTYPAQYECKECHEAINQTINPEPETIKCYIDQCVTDDNSVLCGYKGKTKPESGVIYINKNKE